MHQKIKEKKLISQLFKNGFINGLVICISIGFHQLVLANTRSRWNQALNDQKSWAYPYGVIVQAKVEKLYIEDLFIKEEKKQQQKEPKTQQQMQQQMKQQVQAEQLRRLLVDSLRGMESEVEICTGQKRFEEAVLKTAKLNWVFLLRTRIAVTGHPLEIELKEPGGAMRFTDCVAKAMVALQNIQFPTRMMGTSLSLLLHFEVRFLTDEEAMGRGFLYQLAEDEWKKTYSENRAIWKQCKTDGDCQVVNLNCEVDVINKDSVPDYEANAMKRRKPPCEQLGSLKKNKAKCVKRKCQIR